MIIKIQRPLMTNGDEPMALIYNQDRSFIEHHPYFRVKDLFVVEDEKDLPTKVYHNAVVIGGRLIIGEHVGDQDW